MKFAKAIPSRFLHRFAPRSIMLIASGWLAGVIPAKAHLSSPLVSNTGTKQNDFPQILGLPFGEKDQYVLVDESVAKSFAHRLTERVIEGTGVALLRLNARELAEVSALTHAQGKCGGFEWIGKTIPSNFDLSTLQSQVFSDRAWQIQFQNSPLKASKLLGSIERRQDVTYLSGQVDKQELEKTVTFLSQFHNRFHRSQRQSDVIQAIADRIQGTLPKRSTQQKQSIRVELVNHRSTPQRSIKVTVPGSRYPDQIVILGGHLDSTANWGMGDPKAPGADDNASGSSNVIEVVRILSQHDVAPERTIEFYLYAGEEAGLLGSREIAESYKAQGRNVIAVMQLDMTLYAGSGAHRIALINDFTNGPLNSYIKSLNSLYFNLEVIESPCGYACSDHASWYRNGFASTFPFEAGFDDYNKQIHTANDIIDGRLNFEHSAHFARLALAFTWHVANSTVDFKQTTH